MISYVALGYECNHECICCPLSTHDRLHAPLSFSLIKEKLISVLKESLLENNPLHIVISGGEPTISPHFIDLVHILIDGGADITILSNASSCQDIRFVEKLENALLCKGKDNRLRIQYVTAIHSSNPIEHDKMTGIQGSLRQTMDGLDNLVQRGFNVVIKHILSRVTYRGLLNTFKYLDGHFPSSVQFEICGMDYTGRAGKNSNVLFASFEELQPFVEETLDLIAANNIKRESFLNPIRKIIIKELPLCFLDPCYWSLYAPVQRKLSMYLAPNAKNDDYMKNDVDSDCDIIRPFCTSCDAHIWCQGIWQSTYRCGGDKILRPQKAQT